MCALICLLVATAIVAGLLVGMWARGWMVLPRDHRRMRVLAEEIYAQARLDALARAATQAARDIARQDHRR